MTAASHFESFTICQLVVLTVSYFILSQDFLSTYFYSSLSAGARGGRATCRSSNSGFVAGDLFVLVGCHSCLGQRWQGVSCICDRELPEIRSSGRPEVRRAAWELALDFDETTKLSAVSMTRHGLLKLPNLIDIALFSITTLSVGPAGSWRGNLFWSCGWHHFAGTCAACSFHRWPGRAHENFLRDQGLSFHNRSKLSTFNSFGPGRAPHTLCCETLSCLGGTDRNRSGCRLAEAERSSTWASWEAHSACPSRFDAGIETVFRGPGPTTPCSFGFQLLLGHAGAG